MAGARRLSWWLTGAAVVLVAGAGVMVAPWPVVVIDGDTVDRWPYRHRLAGFDAPEIRRAKCQAERVRGLAAKARLADIVAGAQRVDLISTGQRRDQWGRHISRLEVDGRDLAGIALAEGWAVPYSGRGPRHDWCAE